MILKKTIDKLNFMRYKLVIKKINEVIPMGQGDRKL